MMTLIALMVMTMTIMTPHCDTRLNAVHALPALCRRLEDEVDSTRPPPGAATETAAGLLQPRCPRSTTNRMSWQRATHCAGASDEKIRPGRLDTRGGESVSMCEHSYGDRSHHSAFRLLPRDKSVKKFVPNSEETAYRGCRWWGRVLSTRALVLSSLLKRSGTFESRGRRDGAPPARFTLTGPMTCFSRDGGSRVFSRGKVSELRVLI